MPTKLFNGSSLPCASPLFRPLNTTTTFTDALTPCLAFVAVPSFVVVASVTCLSFLLFYGWAVVAPPVRQTALVWVKGSVCVMVVSAATLRIALTTGANLRYGDPEFVIGRILSLFATVNILVSYMRCRQTGIVSSIWLHFVWLFHILSLLLQLVVTLANYGSINVNYDAISLIIEGICVLVALFVFCFPDQHGRDYHPLICEKDVSPDRWSSTLSRLILKYASNLMTAGHEGTLTFDTLWALEPRNQPEALFTAFNKVLPPQERRSQNGVPWLLKTLISANLFYSGANAALVVIFACFVIGDTITLKFLLDAIVHSYPLWFTLGLIGLMLVCMILRSFVFARMDLYGMIGFMNVATMLTSAIYDKVLRLSSSAKVRYSGGEVINLLSTDVERIRALWFQTTDMIYAPLMLIFTCTGLFLTIGHNLFYGLAVIAFFTPINVFATKLNARFERRQMTFKDERLKLMSDILSGIKVVKLYGWEKSVRLRAAEARAKEVAQNRNSAICFAITETFFYLSPIGATIASLAGYLLVDKHPLTPQIAFVTLLLFNLMRYAIYCAPGVVQNVVNACISCRRLQTFLTEDEILPFTNNLSPSFPDFAIELKAASFAWNQNSVALSSPVLRSLTLSVRRGELIGVIGRVAAGKSSLLAGLCGELNVSDGAVFRDTNLSLAYVPQEHWIQNLTLRDNVLFGRVFDEQLYRKTIEACALTTDLRMLAAGDATEIGERGINLSGGQKARVALARAVYQRADLYVLDDTLSAVDSHVGAHIFEHVLGPSGLLAQSTRIFALNSISYLPKCDRIVVLKDGEIVEVGSYSELCVRKHDCFVELVKELAIRQSMEDSEEELVLEADDMLGELVGQAEAAAIRRRGASGSMDVSAVGHYRRTTSQASESSVYGRQTSVSSTHSTLFQRSLSQQAAECDEAEDDGKLIVEEELVTARTSWQNYVDYIRAFGTKLFIVFVVVMFGLRTSFESANQVWMTKWSSRFVNSTVRSNAEGLAIYGTLGISVSLLVGIACAIIAAGAYRASKRLHDDLLFALLRSPMSFFDTTPLGRIMNRMSGDMNIIDGRLPDLATLLLVLLADFTQSMGSSVFVLPWLLVFVLPTVVAFTFVVRYFTKPSVVVRRLVSASWSSVASQTQETYAGLGVIRAFSRESQFFQKMADIVRTCGEARYAQSLTNGWIQLRVDALTVCMSFCFAVSAVVAGSYGWINIGAVALIVSTGATLRGLLTESGKLYKNIETNAVSVERVQEYIENEKEAEWQTTHRPPEDWPQKGEIRFVNYSLRYRPRTPLVLKDLNLTIAAGQKVGIVGRTGAGKSSLTMALFRLVEPATGTIEIDGLDVRHFGLHDVRRALTIIPQDPVLFCGDLRGNLDPFNELPDSALWTAVEKAHLLPFVQQFPNGLQHEIGEGGSNLSVGQRQLVCLVRAILRRDTRILVLDEATAAVDPQTDDLIQRAIRQEFSSCTVLTIAHRLDTIMDYDRVLVMEAGEVHEFDTPQVLLRNPEGLFHALAKQAKLI